ncbi:hypothetical protein G7054_g1883 [Neopestalotiopsis clavispora]|nr:hypothetical protein G7054_g1883 [Neopestalotiopsis clavispora]
MPSQKKNFRDFLNEVPDEKLEMSQYDGETTINKNNDRGFRLDHQGLNKDEKEKPYEHRLYVQPSGGSDSTSKRSENHQENSGVAARCHATDEATPADVRGGLMESYKNRGNNIGYAPAKSNEEE